AMKMRVETILSKEGLSYTGSVRVRHLLSVLYEDVGVETLKNHISRAFQNLSIAASSGCHALRPSNVTRFDNPVSPVIFDQLVAVTGAHSVDWSKKTDCCGAPLLGINDALSIEMMKRKVSSAKAAGAHYLCTACPFSHIQFDTVQKQFCENNGNQKPMAPILYPQLLGLAMGIDAKRLGVEKSQLDISDIHLFLS
ncbi:MAG: heterodisulfide reductase-related iron-sulfur binding cluster, partial [Desulfobacterales bacterium]|nr:heterodisulfide reductase-related iron-sulfur binding cluster [Desulfobacterales bacterium]